MLNVMMAGRDTVRLTPLRSSNVEPNILQTAGLLTFVTYLLAIHHDVAKRLREEIFDVCGAAGNPTHDLIRKMPYSLSSPPPPFLSPPLTLPTVNAVLNETLRLFPGAPMGIRNSIHEVLLPTAEGTAPLYLPGKARVTWLTLHLHRQIGRAHV